MHLKHLLHPKIVKPVISLFLYSHIVRWLEIFRVNDSMYFKDKQVLRTGLLVLPPARHGSNLSVCLTIDASRTVYSIFSSNSDKRK